MEMCPISKMYHTFVATHYFPHCHPLSRGYLPVYPPPILPGQRRDPQGPLVVTAESKPEAYRKARKEWVCGLLGRATAKLP